MEYIDYLEEHRNLVKDMWQKWRNSVENPFLGNESLLRIMDSLIEVHDFTRLSEVEYVVGEMKFKGEKVPDDVERLATEHHWAMNPHHIEFWYDANGIVSVDMNIRVLYMVEMICDQAALAKQAGDTLANRMRSKDVKMDRVESIVYRGLLGKAIRVLDGGNVNVEVSTGEHSENHERESG